jgi:hypothetical protein
MAFVKEVHLGDIRDTESGLLLATWCGHSHLPEPRCLPCVVPTSFGLSAGFQQWMEKSVQASFSQMCQQKLGSRAQGACWILKSSLASAHSSCAVPNFGG